MKSIKILKPQPSPKSGRGPLTNITNYFHSRPKSDKQTYRSPSHSPRNTNRSTYFDKQQKKVPISKLPLEVRDLNSKCINHKQRTARFRIEGGSPMGVYCEHCALQLSQKGNKVVVVKSQDKANQMVTEARQFIRACENVIVNLNNKIQALNFEKNRVDTKYNKILMEIEQQRRDIIKKINDNYEKQKRQQQQAQKTLIQKLNQQESFFKNMQRQYETLQKDVKQNVNEINHNIELLEFRQIMDIYWQKINKFNQANLKPIINSITQSSQAFVNKYLPPDSNSFNRTIEEVVRGQRNHQGKEFTFSKKFWGLQSKARQTYSYQNSLPITQSNQSIIEQKYRPQ